MQLAVMTVHAPPASLMVDCSQLVVSSWSMLLLIACVVGVQVVSVYYCFYWLQSGGSLVFFFCGMIVVVVGAVGCDCWCCYRCDFRPGRS